MTSGDLQFAAFLSYSRKDVRLARWLVRSLEEFRLPRQTVEDLKARRAPFVAARPIFRDEHDMPVGGVISNRLSEMLDASATMIVMCTASSAKSDWVNREIELFASRHPDRRIIPAVAEGEPDSDETYPHALLKHGKPLAADLRNSGERRQSVIKIAAAVLGLDVDQLVGRVQKHRAEQRRWLAVGGGAAAAVVVGLGVTAGMMANRAKRANDDARTTVEVLLTDAREEVEAAGLLSAKSAVLAAAETYFDGKRPDELNDRDLLLKAKLLRQKGEDAADRRDTNSAISFCEGAFAATEELLSRQKNDPDRLFEHGQSAYWVGDLHWRRAEYEPARAYFEIYLALAQRLLEIKPDYPNAALEVGYANANLGMVAVEHLRDSHAAAEFFSKAMALVEPRATDTEAKKNLSVLYYYQTQALARFERSSEISPLVTKWDALLSELENSLPEDRSISFDLARDLNLVGEFQRRMGRSDQAKIHTTRALAIAKEHLRGDPDNKDWLAFASGLDLKLAASPSDCSNIGNGGVTDLSEARRTLSCLKRSDPNNRQICKKFAADLAAQPPSIHLEDTWSAILNRCSKDRSVAADPQLIGQLDQIAESMFFSGDARELSLWTQIELANLKTGGVNAARISDLRRDLERRGWNVDQS